MQQLFQFQFCVLLVIFSFFHYHACQKFRSPLDSFHQEAISDKQVCIAHQKLHYSTFSEQFENMAQYLTGQDSFYKRMNGRWNFQCRPDTFMVNVGANSGQNLDYFWNQFGKVCPSTVIHLFEPNPMMHSSLVNATAAVVGLTSSNYKLHNYALSNVSARMQFALPNIERSELGFLITRTTHLPKYGVRFKKKLVKVTTLDSVFGHYSNLKIPLLKIDTEGFDGRVLQGGLKLLKKNVVDVIIFECSHLFFRRGGMTLKEVVLMLGEQGYLSFKLGDPVMIRLDPPYWSDVYEPKFWSDCISVNKHSSVLQDLPLLC